MYQICLQYVIYRVGRPYREKNCAESLEYGRMPRADLKASGTVLSCTDRLRPVSNVFNFFRNFSFKIWKKNDLVEAFLLWL